MTTDTEPRLCACGCGEPLHPHANRRARFRQGHREAARSRGVLCQCGQPKTRARGARYCDECREAMRTAAQKQSANAIAAREAARSRLTRQRAEEWIRICARCGESKPKPDMKPDPRRKSGVSSYCLICAPIQQHEASIKHSFGIDAEEYYRLLALQDGVCAICGKAPRKQRLAVDHDHKTGEIRGLLCVRCNHRVLGGAGEDSAVLRRAADYLEQPPTRSAGINIATPEVTERQLAGWVDQLEDEIDQAGADTGAVIVKRRGTTDIGRHYAVMTVDRWEALMTEAGR